MDIFNVYNELQLSTKHQFSQAFVVASLSATLMRNSYGEATTMVKTLITTSRKRAVWHPAVTEGQRETMARVKDQGRDSEKK